MKYTRALKYKRKALFKSAVSLILCFAMLTGTTFAWFTETESSDGNIIQSGSLKIGLDYKQNAADQWQDASKVPLFHYDRWEPGYSDMRYLRISNQGNLAFQYQLVLEPVIPAAGTNGASTTSEEPNTVNQAEAAAALAESLKLAEVIDVYFANISDEITSRDIALKKMTKLGTLADMIRNGNAVSQGIILPNPSLFAPATQVSASIPVDTGETAAVIMLKMRENAGNEYMGLSAGDGFTVKVLATQYTYEEDAFGTDYDTGAVKEIFPDFVGTSGTSATVNTSSDGKTTEDVTLGSGDITAMVPQGTQVKDGTRVLTLTVTEKDAAEGNITIGETDAVRSLDIHIDGIDENNTTPIVVNLGPIMPVGQNDGNVTLYHVENGQANAMKRVYNLNDLVAHNDYFYEAVTGDVIVAMATFSEVDLIADTTNKWNGNIDVSWYDADKSEFVIANADQLAGLNKIVSGAEDYDKKNLEEYPKDSFAGKSVKLIRDISLKDCVWYPIGYWKEGNEIATAAVDGAPEAAYIIEEDTKTPVTMAAVEGEWYTYGGPFKGTFDGDGHTISNIYQNTWELKGNYDGNYWNAAMGIFGYVYGGTIKNLNVDNFKSDGEFTSTGVIAAYASNSTFSNIAITNCNPRVYNTGNGGIVGIGGNSSDGEDYKLTFQNITIDNSNKISALWGSWDVACGGLVGMFRGPGSVDMLNCHVAAQIDVYNDVCGNYQYYWYRYSGMLIGTNKNMTTDSEGYTVPETSKFHAENCTVHFGDWNDYYYCELVANSLASYTHDHQFSRLTEISSLNEIQSGGAWTQAGNFLLTGADNSRTCYHIVKDSNGTLKQHLHTEAGKETVNGKLVDKEDKQIVYLPFNQLFTGYGWGVKHIPIYDDGTGFDGVTFQQRDVANSVTKFNARAPETLTDNKVYTLGELFAENTANTKEPLGIQNSAVVVTVHNYDTNNPVSATINQNSENWENSTIEFTGTGIIKLTIQDYYYCCPTAVDVTITERQPEPKFKATDKKDYYSGKELTMASLFTAVEGASINTNAVSIDVTTTEAVKAEWLNNAEHWAEKKIRFSGEGKVTFEIYDDDKYCKHTKLEVNVNLYDKFNAVTQGDFVHAREYPITDFFTAKDNAEIDSNEVQITVVPDAVDYNRDKSDWTNSTIKFKEKGEYRITITEDANTRPVSKTVTVDERPYVTKFEPVAESKTCESESIVDIEELFKALVDEIDHSNVEVVITAIGESSTVKGEWVYDKTDWTNGKITFTGVGEATVLITDKDFCNDATMTVEIKPVDKFTAKANEVSFESGKEVTLSELFGKVEGANIDSNLVKVTTSCDGAYAEYKRDSSNWEQSKLTFSGEGNVTITIQEKAHCNSIEVKVNVKLIEKFECAGEINYVSDTVYHLEDFFGTKAGADIASSAVKVATESSTVNAVYTANASDWKQGTLIFYNKDNAAEGKVTITIAEDAHCQSVSKPITVTQRQPEDKFVQVEKEIVRDAGKEIQLGDLFQPKAGAEINSAMINVSFEPENSGEYKKNETDWTKGILTFTGTGDIKVIITEDEFCKEATKNITIKRIEKFETVFENVQEYTYRVGNKNTVSLGSLFKAKQDVNNGTVVVAITGDASGNYTSNDTDWTNGTIQFSGTGDVTVTIQDSNSEIATLDLEVVDAVNATSATSAKSNNVVLLKDVGFSTLEVSGGYTLYGNGFKMTATTDPMYDTMNAGFVVLKNGTLDNVQVICPNFSYAIIYNSQIKDKENTAVPSDNSNAARGNVRSAVMADGNSKIVNSYVHGGRAAVFLRSGNLVIDGSTISGGAAANIHALSAQSLTLRNATLIQKPFEDNVHNTKNTIMGFSGLFECGEDGNSTPLILEGTLVQDAWINKDYAEYTPSAASSIVNTALGKTDFLHDLDGDGKNESLNLGFTYIPQDTNGSTNAKVSDNRTNKTAVPYAAVDVGNAFASAKVYSYKNTNGTSNEFKENTGYTPNQGVTPPTVTFIDTNADRVFETKFDANDGRWESTLTVDLDNVNYTFSFKNLLVQKHGKNLTYTVKTADGTEVDASKAITLAASGVTDYVLTVTDDGATHTIYFTLTATKTSIPDPEVADTTGGTPLLVVKSKGGDWSCAIPALEGMKVRYYTADGEKILDLATLTPTSTGKQNGTQNYWETTKDGYKLKVTCGYIHDTKQVYGMPVVVNNGGNKLYFTISSTNGYVSTNTAARSVTLSYEFTDPNGKTLTFSKTWNFQYADYKNGTQYSYSDFVNGTLKEAGSGSSCVTPDTLVTLADGTQKRIDAVTYSDQLLVWDFYKGEYAAVPSAIIFDHGYDNNTVIKLSFSDGTDVKVVNLHQFYDVTLNKFVSITAENVDQYVGHAFSKQGGKNVTLVDYTVSQEYVEAYGIISAQHYNIFVEGMLSTDFMPEDYDLFNYFDFGSDMKFDQAKMQTDIEKYGLYTYEEFADRLTYEQFVGFNVPYMKVAVGKGNYTYEGILNLISNYLGQ